MTTRDGLIDWVEREMLPHFVAPLTERGRQLIRLIDQREKEMVANGDLPEEQTLRVAQEGFFEMVAMSYFKRLPRISLFQDVTMRQR